MFLLSDKEVESLLEALKPVVRTNPHYPDVKLKELSEEEVYEIHKNGKITPEEWIREMEEDYSDYCPLSNESSRCRTYKDCHDCLVDYANQEGSFYPMKDAFLKNPFSDNELNSLINAISSDITLVKKKK